MPINIAKAFPISSTSLSPPWTFGARAEKEEGAIPIRDSVEALEKPMELAKGNAPKVGAFRASRTSMLNFPGFDRVHR